MDRRDFIAAMLGQGILLAGMPGALAMGTDAKDKPYKTTELTNAALERLGGMSLQELREYHVRYLLDEFLPPWLEHGVDWEHGGYFRGLFPDGPPAEHEKEMYYEGRGLWLFAYAYNHFGKNPRHLEAAELGRKFLIKNALRDDGTFVDSVDRRGKVMEAEANVYGNMYMILGLAELWRANGDEENLDIAVRAAHGVMERLVAPDYQFRFKNHGGPYQPGDRRLGAWQHFLGSLTPLLRARRDPAVEKIAELCVRNIMERHWRSDVGAFFGVLDQQYQPYPHGHEQRAFSGWHSIQACWIASRIRSPECLGSSSKPGSASTQLCRSVKRTVLGSTSGCSSTSAIAISPMSVHFIFSAPRGRS